MHRLSPGPVEKILQRKTPSLLCVPGDQERSLQNGSLVLEEWFHSALRCRQGQAACRLAPGHCHLCLLSTSSVGHLAGQLTSVLHHPGIVSGLGPCTFDRSSLPSCLSLQTNNTPKGSLKEK